MGRADRQDKTDVLRQQLDRQAARVKEDHKRELFRKRLEMARAGVTAYTAGRMGEALKYFMWYLKILEEFKGVKAGTISPSHFDRKTELPEMIMLSGMFWDLAKIYDRKRVNKKDDKREYKTYLEKYVLFSRGMPHQTLSAEALRKYVILDKAIHKSEFNTAYKALSNEKCFVATSLAEHTLEETPLLLKDFRDQILRKFSLGRMFILWYYSHGPAIARSLDQKPEWMRKTVARALDFFAVFFLK